MEIDITWFFLFVAIFPVISHCWNILFLPLRLFGIRTIKVDQQSKLSKIKKIIGKKASILENGEDGLEFIWGKWFVGYIYKKSNDRGDNSIEYAYIFTTLLQFKKIIKGSPLEEYDANGNKLKELDYWYRYHNFYFLKYEKDSISGVRFELTREQNKALESIISIYQENKYCVCYIYGDPGSGKTDMGRIIATRLNGTLCDTFDPTDPNDDLNKLRKIIGPTFENPLILVLDEIEIILRKIDNNGCGIEQHRTIPISVRNKTGWNRMLDKFSNGGFYQNIILLLVSNCSPDEIFNNDKSKTYLRKKRINFYAKFDGKELEEKDKSEKKENFELGIEKVENLLDTKE